MHEEAEHSEKRFYFRTKTVLTGVLFGASFWVIDTIVDISLFVDHTFVKQFFHPEPIELWMRLVVILLFVVFGLLSGHIIEKMERADSRLRKSVEEKNLLLKEIHHRVKNNMSLISSLLTLQSEYVTNESSRLLFGESCNRIKSMALIHDKLYQSSDFVNIDFGNYIKILTDELFSTYHVNRTEINMKTDIDDVTISVENAIPCGLIINELVTNALKYAFRGRSSGEIFISMKATDTGRTRLTIKDNGSGPSGKLNTANPDTIGMLIVKSLVEQMEADIKVSLEEGVEFIIEFGEGG